jgi:hypothetical protein
MNSQLRIAMIDRIAIGVSGLCIIHCVLSVLFVALLSGAGSIISDPLVHRLGLVGAVLLAAVAMSQGFVVHREMGPAAVGMVGLAFMVAGLFVPHGWVEVALTIVGVSIVAVAHVMNVRAGKTS